MTRNDPIHDPQRLAQIMDEQGLDALIASSFRHAFYLSDFYGDPAGMGDDFEGTCTLDPARRIAATSPALLFLSNGPGDPAHPALHGVVELLRAARRRWPVVGICLGHQLLALALGGTTTKLRYGHRGVNQPVYDTVHDRVFITSQNHGYAVNHLPEGVAQTFVNLNDDTCEGLAAENCWSVQFHPEATPGPTDARALFHRVLQTATPDGEPAMREADSTTDDERPAGGGGSA